MSDPISPYLAGRARGMLAVLVLAVGGLFGYVVHQRNQVNRLSNENNQVVSLLKDTRAQMLSLTSKLDAMAATQAAPQQASLGTDLQSPAPRQENHPKAAAAKHHAAGDPRFKRIQTQIDAQGKEIASTREELASTRSDLQGSIAKTHGELVVLQKKGERNYYEFDLDKSKQFQRTGPVGISLRKANTKHMYADLELMVDDAQLSKKHVNLFEPVLFYPGDERQPVELVINSIHKNHIHGYISGPKYTATELAAAPAGDSNGAASGANAQQSTQESPTRQRRKLELPR
jgi:predicted negative regulator of RcsB-dependent stress response